MRESEGGGGVDISGVGEVTDRPRSRACAGVIVSSSSIVVVDLSCAEDDGGECFE